MRLKFKDNVYSGRLITFCGLDGSGKTTMINLLEKYLLSKSYKCVIVKQPSADIRNNPLFRASVDQPYSDKINYRAVSMLCVADKLQHSTKVIEPLMKDGCIVISDRYFYSSLANLEAYGFQNEKWIYEISEQIVKPDAAFFLRVNPQTAIERVRKRENERNRFISKDIQEKLAKVYFNIATANNGTLVDCENRIDDSFDMVRQIIDGVIF